MKKGMSRMELVAVIGLMVVSVAALVVSGGGFSFVPTALASGATQVTIGGSDESSTILTRGTGTGTLLPPQSWGSGTSGQVAFGPNATTLSGDDNLQWDNTDKRLVITAGPSMTARPLHLIGNICLFERAANSAGFIINRTGVASANRWVVGADEPTGFVIKTYPVDGGTAVEQLVITKDNPSTPESESKVGIGTAAPGYKLTIRGSGNEVYSVMSEDGTDSVDNVKVQIAPGGGTPTSRIGHLFGNFGHSDSGFLIGNLRNAPLRFGVGPGPTERMRINANGNVGIGTATPNSKLQIGGSFAAAYRQVSGAYGVTADDCIIEWDEGVAGDITLPSATGNAGRLYTIIKPGGSTTIHCSGGQTINGTSTYTLSGSYAYVTVVSNGSNWLIVSHGP